MNNTQQHPRRPFLNGYNAIVLIAVLGVAISTRYAILGNEAPTPKLSGQIDTPPELDFYRTIRDIKVPTTGERPTHGKTEWLQAGVFAQRKNAEQQLKRLRNLDINATMEISPKGLHVILIGPFNSRQSLQSTRQRLIHADLATHSVWRK